MWLLNAYTRRLDNFLDERQMVAAYAILSHTWGKFEVGFDDIHHDYAKSMDGYHKIEYTCVQALKDHITYVWIDTCCIDKKSSAELSEAINSMYRWYYNAQVCYAYLEDVLTPAEDVCAVHHRSTFLRMWSDISASRWFTRGWTLQELIAPRRVEFYDKLWNPLGTKEDVMQPLSGVTGISAAVLRDRDQMQHASIAQKMAWASRRTTSRLEDQAYCLLGLSDVNIALMYGEGKRAFVRLQEEIIHTRSWEGQDHSILAFRSMNGDLLASGPEDFGVCQAVSIVGLAGDGVFELSRRGLRISVLGRRLPGINRQPNDGCQVSNDLVILLNCTKDSGRTRVGLQLRTRPQTVISDPPRWNGVKDELVYDRLPDLLDVGDRELLEYHRMEITIARRAFAWPCISRHLVIRCPGTYFELFSRRICSGLECDSSSPCHLQHETDLGGQPVTVSYKTVRDRGWIRMESRGDGKMFAEFKVRFCMYDSGDALHTMRHDTTVYVEADNQTDPPVLRAHCCGSERHDVASPNCKQLHTLSIGTARLPHIDSGKDMHLEAGLGVEMGEGCWHVIFKLAGSGMHSTADPGLPTAPSTSQGPRLASSRPSASSISAPLTDVGNAVKVRALQRDVLELRRQLWFLYQKTLHDNEELVRKRKQDPRQRQGAQSLSRKGRSIASVIMRALRTEGTAAAIDDAGPSEPTDLHEDYIVVASSERGAANRMDELYELDSKMVYEMDAETATIGAVPEEDVVSEQKFYEEPVKSGTERCRELVAKAVADPAPVDLLPWRRQQAVEKRNYPLWTTVPLGRNWSSRQ